MSTTENLKNIRTEINKLDQNILDSIAKRRKLSISAVKEKDANSSPLRDLEREQDLILNCIEQGRALGLDAHFISKLYTLIIDDSNRLQSNFIQEKINRKETAQNTIRVAVEGLSFSSSKEVSEQHFVNSENQVEIIGHKTYLECIRSVELGKADYAVVPIENTAAGAINEVYTLIQNSQLSIVGEEEILISEVLLGLPEVKRSEISVVECTADALNFCSRFISSNSDLEIRIVKDLGQSAQKIVSNKIKNTAVIGPKTLIQHAELSVIDDKITNHQNLLARYVVLARKPIAVDLRIPCKTSLIIATSQESGALVKVLLVFQENGIKLSKLESRPVADNPREELFYLDFIGNLQEGRIKRAIDELSLNSKYVRVLGSYPIHSIAAAEVEIKPAAAVEETTNKNSEVPKSKPKTDSKSSSYKLASREYKASDTIINVKGVKIGGDNFITIAGPCSVESNEQIMSCARHCKDNGAKILRGGCFKPRTSPYSFQGMGYEGLEYLVEAGKVYDLPVVTEVLAQEDLKRVAETSDIIQIGARNMQNFSLLIEAGKLNRPIILKRGMSASIIDLLQAAEYILSQGNLQVILCERGIRTFETATRSTLDLSAVPVLKEKTHLPIIVDPSHAAGERNLVTPLALAAKAVGAHGIMVEFHPKPEEALSDGPQALYFDQFSEMMRKLA